jgi:hypothetical protein
MKTAKPHKHKELIDIYYASTGWWDVYYGMGIDWQRVAIPTWNPDLYYKLEKSALHPDNIKPKKRLIDWSKMPRGAMTNYGMLWEATSPNVIWLIADKEDGLYSRSQHTLRLAEQTQFTYWGGGECPVPDGVVVEVTTRERVVYARESVNLIWRHDDDYLTDIIAYRITGLADGWTDDPEASV